MKEITALSMTLILVLWLCTCTAAQLEDSAEESSQAPTWQEQYDLGIRYLSENNYQEAIIAFTAAIEIDPKQVPAYVGRGDAYVLSGETEDNLAAAKADYEKAIELDEANAEAYLGLADVYTLQGDIEATRTILEQGLAVTGDARLQARLDELDEIERQESRPEGASETVTAIGHIIYNPDEYWDQWHSCGSYIGQYQTKYENIVCDIDGYGVRFESAIDVRFYSGSIFIQEAEAINAQEMFDTEVELHSYTTDANGSMVGHRMELRGYFCPHDEAGEITGPKYEEDEMGNYKNVFTYHPNGNYCFYIESYTLLD